MVADEFNFRKLLIPAYGPTFLFGIGYGAILPVIVISAVQHGASVPLAALMTTVIAVASLLTNIPASFITERFGEKWAMVGAGTWGAAGMALALFSPHLATFVLAMVMVGMTNSVFNLARQSYLTEAVPYHFRARALSTLGGVQRIGVFIGPILGAGVITLMGTSGAYLVGLVAVAASTLLALTLPELEKRVGGARFGAADIGSPSATGASSAAGAGRAAGVSGSAPAGQAASASDTSASDTSASDTSASDTSALGTSASDTSALGTSGAGKPHAGKPHAGKPTVWNILHRYRTVFATIGFGVVMIGAIRASRQVVIPLWGSHIGLNEATISLIYALVGLVDMAVFYPAGKVMDGRGRLFVAVPCMLLMGIGTMLLPLTTHIWTYTLVSMVIGFGNGLGSGIVMTLGADYSPERGRPQFLGIWRLETDFGALVGPAVISWLTAAFTLGVGIASAGVFGLAGVAALWYFLPRITPGSVRQSLQR